VNPLIKIINIVALLIVPIIASIHGGKQASAMPAAPIAMVAPAPVSVSAAVPAPKAKNEEEKK
jgi:hypothetical protein